MAKCLKCDQCGLVSGATFDSKAWGFLKVSFDDNFVQTYNENGTPLDFCSLRCLSNWANSKVAHEENKDGVKDQVLQRRPGRVPLDGA